METKRALTLPNRPNHALQRTAPQSLSLRSLGLESNHPTNQPPSLPASCDGDQHHQQARYPPRRARSHHGREQKEA